MPAPDHGEAVRAGEIAALRQFTDRLLARIDEVGVLLPLIGKGAYAQHAVLRLQRDFHARSEEHTSELQSLMRISYAVFCFKKKKTKNSQTDPTQQKIIQ